MQKKLLIKVIALIMVIAVIVGCGSHDTAKLSAEPSDKNSDNQELIVIGFSQVGAESDWRKANTESMKNTFTEENGYKLIFSDAQQKQNNQITAIRTFIQQEVDYIVLAPVTENGWDTVLSEAKEANIPVIIVDRMVNVEDSSLFTCWVGSDFKLEGDKVCKWLKAYADNNEIEPQDIHIVNIQGTLGASSQIGRSRGLRDAITRYGWDLKREAQGEYTQAKAREVMTKILNDLKDVNVVYCENDNEAFGAIEAIEAAGRVPGSDIMSGQIMVLSFDGVSEQAIEYAKAGKISCIGECNPLHGPRVRSIIESLEKGEPPNKYEYVMESLFSSVGGITSVECEGESSPVVFLN